MDGGGSESTAKAAAHGDADLSPSAGGAWIRGQLFQCKAVCAQEKADDEAGDRGLSAAGAAEGAWAGGLWGMPVL